MRLEPHLFLSTSLQLFIDIYKEGKLSGRKTVFIKKGKTKQNTWEDKAIICQSPSGSIEQKCAGYQSNRQVQTIFE